MKSAGLSLLCLVSAGPLAAQIVESVNPAKTSARLSQEIRATLSKFTPPATPPPTSGSVATPSSPSDPDVLELPKMTVREKYVPRINPVDLLTKDARGKKLARDYKSSLKGLDALLNGFSIPILSPSMAERGRAAYQAQQMEELRRIAGISKLADAEASSDLQKDVSETQRAIERQNRPAGSK